MCVCVFLVCQSLHRQTVYPRWWARTDGQYFFIANMLRCSFTVY